MDIHETTPFHSTFSHKVHLPPVNPTAVARPRLYVALDALVQQRLALLVAPAGYGKTTLLIEWAHTTQLPVIWFAIDRFDTDPHVFVAYLADACIYRFPDAFPQTHHIRASESHDTHQALLNTLLRELAMLNTDAVLVLDDWHLVDHVEAIADVVALLLARVPRCRVVVTSRVYPAIPDLMLLTARGQVMGVSADALRFTETELETLLDSSKQQSEGDARSVQQLLHQTNGWITAILFLAHLLPGGDVAPPTAASGVTERHLYHFLAEQVLHQQPPEVQQFLLDAALLEDIQVDQITALLDRADAGTLLAYSARQQLFLSELSPGVLRFHPLFREFLIERYRALDLIQFRASARHIARVYADHQQWSHAFDLLCRADDLHAAHDVLLRAGPQLYRAGHLATLEQWFAVLPLDDLSAKAICLKGQVALDRGQHDTAQALADLAQARMRPDEEATVRLFQAAVARTDGQYEAAIVWTERVRALQPDPETTAAALRLAVICHLRLGNGTQAIALAEQALAIQRARGDAYHMALLYHNLGMCHEHAGQLELAAQCYDRADGCWTTIGNHGNRALTRNSAGVLQHALGQYVAAYATLTAALQDAEAVGIRSYLSVIHTSLADLLTDLQLVDAAEQQYRQALALEGNAYIHSYATFAFIRLLLQRRKLTQAIQMFDLLPSDVCTQQPGAVEYIRGTIAFVQHNMNAARSAGEAAWMNATQQKSWADAARACLLLARVAARATPGDAEAMITWLQRAHDAAQQLGQDTLLVAETVTMPDLLHQAVVAGWKPAATLLARHAELQQSARQIDPQKSKALLTVRTLGMDQIELNGTPLDLGWAKAREVLLYLLEHPEGASGDVLATAVWSDRTATQSRKLLHEAMYRLRSQLPPDSIVLRQRRIYVLNPIVLQCEYDVAAFVTATEPAATETELFGAIARYHGPFASWIDSVWCEPLRSMLEQRMVQALSRAAHWRETQQRFSEALELHQQALALDPLHETAAAGTMRCFMALGNRSAAIDSYHALRRRLDEDLGLSIAPSSEAAKLYTDLLRAS